MSNGSLGIRKEGRLNNEKPYRIYFDERRLSEETITTNELWISLRWKHHQGPAMGFPILSEVKHLSNSRKKNQPRFRQ